MLLFRYVHGRRSIPVNVVRRPLGADYQNAQEEVGSETTDNTGDEEQMDISDDQDNSSEYYIEYYTRGVAVRGTYANFNK